MSHEDELVADLLVGHSANQGSLKCNYNMIYVTV